METGPGLSSTSPARRRRRKRKKLKRFALYNLIEMLDRIMKKVNGILSKHFETDENGNGWYTFERHEGKGS